MPTLAAFFLGFFFGNILFSWHFPGSSYGFNLVKRLRLPQQARERDKNPLYRGQRKGPQRRTRAEVDLENELTFCMLGKKFFGQDKAHSARATSCFSFGLFCLPSWVRYTYIYLYKAFAGSATLCSDRVNAFFWRGWDGSEDGSFNGGTLVLKWYKLHSPADAYRTLECSVAPSKPVSSHNLLPTS